MTLFMLHHMLSLRLRNINVLKNGGNNPGLRYITILEIITLLFKLLALLSLF